MESVADQCRQHYMLVGHQGHPGAEAVFGRRGHGSCLIGALCDAVSAGRGDLFFVEHPSVFNRLDVRRAALFLLQRCRAFAKQPSIDNTKAFLNTIVKLRPSSAKGQYVKSLYLSATMGPGLKISKDDLNIIQ